MTGGAAKGALGGSANEQGAEYRRAVAAYYVAHGLRGRAVRAVDVPTPDATVSAVTLETDHPVDDIAVELTAGYRLMIQAKRSLEDRAVLREVVRQWVKAVAAPGFDHERHRIVLCTGNLAPWAKPLLAVINRERTGLGGGRTTREQAAMSTIDEVLSETSTIHAASVRRAAVVLPLSVEEEHLPDAAQAISLLDGHVVISGEGESAWRALLHIAGRMARERTGGDMRRWRELLRDAGAHLAPLRPRRAPRVVPRSLPAAPQGFVNREAELASLTELGEKASAAAGPVVALLLGPRGVGKSAVALQWAAENKRRFRGGHLYGDFSKRDERGITDPSGILATFLRDLGVSEWEIPPDEGGRTRLFRTETAKRKLLVLLDDVVEPAEVTPFIPTGAGSMVLVTSHHRLPELLAERRAPVRIRPLREQSARDLLGAMIGDGRAHEDEEGVAQLTESCGGLPVALCVCGAYLADHEEMSPSTLAQRIRAQPEKLFRLLRPGSTKGMDVLEFAYRDLGRLPASLYRLLGATPTLDVATHAAAALGSVTFDEADAALEALYDAHLVEVVTSGRYRMHSVVRDHARLAATRDDPEPVREAAVRRLVAWYAWTAHAADLALVRERTRAARFEGQPPAGLAEFQSPDDAFRWFDEERSNILAVLQAARDLGCDEWTWQIVEALWNLYSNRRTYADWEQSHGLGLQAAVKCGNRAAEAQIRKQRSRLYAETGRSDLARVELEAAQAAADDAGDPMIIGTVIEFTGTFLTSVADYEGAFDKFQRARAVYKELGFPRGIAMQDLLLGAVLVRQDAPDKALAPLELARETMISVGDDFSVARIQVWLGEALKNVGELARAAEVLEDAVRTLSHFGLQLEEAQALEALGEVAELRKDSRAAYEFRCNAYDIYRDLRHPRAETVAASLTASSPED